MKVNKIQKSDFQSLKVNKIPKSDFQSLKVNKIPSLPAPIPASPFQEPSQFAIVPAQVPVPAATHFPVPLSQGPIPVSPSLLTQESIDQESTQPHRYPTRFSLSQDNYSMGCAAKYVHATKFITASAASTAVPTNIFSKHYAAPVIDPTTGESLKYRHLMNGPDKFFWEKALANDLGRLAQGVGTRMPTENNTIFFVHPSEIPLHKKVTYGRLVVDIRPLKSEKYRVRVTVGGDKLEFVGDASSVAASLSTVKLLSNSVVSTEDAIFTTADVKDFFYGSILPDPEYMKLALKIIPQEIIQQ